VGNYLDNAPADHGENRSLLTFGAFPWRRKRRSQFFSGTACEEAILSVVRKHFARPRGHNLISILTSLERAVIS